MAELKLRAVISVADKASGPLKKINADLRKLSAPFQRLSRQMKGFDNASGFRRLRTGVAGMTGSLARMTGAAGAAATAGLFALSKMASVGDEISKTSIALGISTDALQAWLFVAERSGVSTATLNKSMQAFTKRMAEARNGSGELFNLLKKTNPALLNQVLAIDDNAEAYDFMVKAMAGLATQQEQILLGDKAFSEAGRELVKVAAAGATEIDRLKQEARDMGLILGEDALKNSAKFRDQMAIMALVLRSAAFTIGTELMPKIIEISKRFTEWFRANQKLIKQNLGNVAKKIAAGIGQVGEFMATTLPRITAFVDSIGGLRTVAIALGAVLAGPLISAVATLGAVILTTPIGWFVGGIALMVAAFVGLEKHLRFLNDITFDDMKAVVTDIGNWLISFWDQSIAAVMEKIQPMLDIGKRLSGFVSGIFGGANAASAPRSAVSGARGAAPGLIQQSARQPLGRLEAGGLLKIQIDQAGQARVKKVVANNPDFPIDVDTGLAFGGAL
jgi:hypothetical protein